MASKKLKLARSRVPWPPDSDTIERYALRIELAWRRVPTLRLAELVTLALRNTIAPLYALDDDALVEAIEAYAEAAR
jgi:hypothetical protein